LIATLIQQVDRNPDIEPLCVNEVGVGEDIRLKKFAYNRKQIGRGIDTG
jgi:hypothetical protein